MLKLSFWPVGSILLCWTCGILVFVSISSQNCLTLHVVKCSSSLFFFCLGSNYCLMLLIAFQLLFIAFSLLTKCVSSQTQTTSTISMFVFGRSTPPALFLFLTLGILYIQNVQMGRLCQLIAGEVLCFIVFRLTYPTCTSLRITAWVFFFLRSAGRSL